MAIPRGKKVRPLTLASEPNEASLQRAVLAFLRRHPDVAWIERFNSGSHAQGGRWISYGFPGCADLLGQMSDGRLLAVEVKDPRGRLSREQQVFLERVARYGGTALVAHSVEEVRRALGSGLRCIDCSR